LTGAFTFTSGLTERVSAPETPVAGLTVVAFAESLDNAASWSLLGRRDGARFEPGRRGAATTGWRVWPS